MFYTAYFVPQAWQKDYANDVDPQGPQFWDCTEFVNSEAACEVFKVGNPAASMLDGDDVLRGDDAAPQWVKDWSGPFSIYVTRHESEAEMLIELALKDDKVAAERLRGLYAELSHGPHCSYRCKGECDCIKLHVVGVLEECGLEVS